MPSSLTPPPLRAVIYTRYSSELQSEASIEDQVRLCRALIERHGWTLEAVYEDRATSGASTHRADYLRLLGDARNNRFDLVVAEALDRLSRDLEDIAALHKRLSFLGIRLATVAEGDVGDLQVGLKGTMNALFLKDLADKTRRGLEGRVRQGRSGGGLSYGYRAVKQLDSKGEPVRGLREINPEEAMVIRRIFELFVSGVSPVEIARRLNAEALPGPRGRTWADTTIRGHHKRGTGILRNELYIGRLVWNRQRFLKDPETGKRIARMNPSEHWVIEEVPELQIIDQDLWNLAHARLDDIRHSPGVTKVRENRFWEKRRPRHLLTGLVSCGVCGNTMATVGQDYLACNHARRRGTCTNAKSIRRGGLENLILDGLKNNLMPPELVKEFTAAFHEEIRRQQKQDQIAWSHQKKELDEVERKIDRLLDAVADGLPGVSIADKLDALEKRKCELKSRLPETAPAPVTLHPNLAEHYRRDVEKLQGLLEDPETRAEAIEIIRSLIDRNSLTLSDDCSKPNSQARSPPSSNAQPAQKPATNQPLQMKRSRERTGTW